MFQFEKLEVYKKARNYNFQLKNFISTHQLEESTKDQLHRASLSIMLNIAEGSARKTNRDRAHFLVIARSSLFECVSIFDYLKFVNKIEDEEYFRYYSMLEEISKMLFSLTNYYNTR